MNTLEKIQSLTNAANEVTGKADENLTNAVKSLIEGYSKPIIEKTIIGVPPLALTAEKAGAASAYKLIGNEQHSGTATPTTPIMPQGTGERTANLLPSVPKTVDVRSVTVTMYSNRITLHGTASGSGGRNKKLVDNFVLPAGTYRAKTYGNSSNAIFFLNKASDATVLAQLTDTVITLEQDTEVFMGVNVVNDTVYNEPSITIMLNAGSTALPYEPYGQCKIPISSAGRTTPVYLGQTQTVRRVKKLVLTGDEVWYVTEGRFRTLIGDVDTTARELSICSHFPYKSSLTEDNRFDIIISSGGTVRFRYDSAADLDAFKAYLAAQYSEGTPVTLWYVLAEPETAIVNEPLMKIGDYADELHSTSQTPPLMLAKGVNVIDVITDVKPSSMTITYK